MPDAPRAAWPLLSASLSGYDRDGLRAALTATLDAGLPVRGKLPREWEKRGPLLASVQADIVAHTGAWYPGGRIPVYSEQLGGACTCHSFCPVGVTAERSRPEAVSACADGVLAEVDRIWDYLTALAAFFAGLALPEDPAERLVALEEAAESLIDLIILHTDTHDCWYPLIIDAGVWMAEVVGVAPADLEERLERTVTTGCTSWTPPQPAQRRAMHADIAEILG